MNETESSVKRQEALLKEMTKQSGSNVEKARDINKLLINLRESYKTAIILTGRELLEKCDDPSTVTFKDYHLTLWKTCFYKQIDEYRRSLKKTKDIVDAVPRLATYDKAIAHLAQLVAAFMKYLTNAMSWYQEMLYELESNLKEYLPPQARQDENITLSPNKSKMISGQTTPMLKSVSNDSLARSITVSDIQDPIAMDEDDKNVKKSFIRNYFSQSIAKCLLYLGDLARYRALHSTDADLGDYSEAERYYKRAHFANPHNGNANNQMALLASYSTDVLSSIYFYYRALCSQERFNAALTSLQGIFTRLEEKSLDLMPSKGQPSSLGVSDKRKTHGHSDGESTRHLHNLYPLFLKRFGEILSQIHLIAGKTKIRLDGEQSIEFDVSKIAEDFEASSTQFLKTFEELMVILSERLPSVVPSLSTTVFAMMNHDHFPLRVFVTLISSIHLSVMNTLQSIQGMTYQADRIDSLSDDMESSAKDMNIISMNVKSLCESISFTLLYKMITRMANHLDKILTEKYSDWHANEKGSKGLRPVTIANHISVHMSRILISLHICLEYLSTTTRTGTGTGTQSIAGDDTYPINNDHIEKMIEEGYIVTQHDEYCLTEQRAKSSMRAAVHSLITSSTWQRIHGSLASSDSSTHDQMKSNQYSDSKKLKRESERPSTSNILATTIIGEDKRPMKEHLELRGWIPLEDLIEDYFLMSSPIRYPPRLLQADETANKRRINRIRECLDQLSAAHAQLAVQSSSYAGDSQPREPQRSNVQDKKPLNLKKDRSGKSPEKLNSPVKRATISDTRDVDKLQPLNDKRAMIADKLMDNLSHEKTLTAPSDLHTYLSGMGQNSILDPIYSQNTMDEDNDNSLMISSLIDQLRRPASQTDLPIHNDLYSLASDNLFSSLYSNDIFEPSPGKDAHMNSINLSTLDANLNLDSYTKTNAYDEDIFGEDDVVLFRPQVPSIPLSSSENELYPLSQSTWSPPPGLSPMNQSYSYLTQSTVNYLSTDMTQPGYLSTLNSMDNTNQLGYNSFFTPSQDLSKSINLATILPPPGLGKPSDNNSKPNMGKGTLPS